MRHVIITTGVLICLVAVLVVPPDVSASPGTEASLETLILASNPGWYGTEEDEEDPFYDPFEEDRVRIELSDPLESWNRGMFFFNDGLVEYVVIPSSRNWERVSGADLRQGIHNFFSNLREPRNLVNALLQAEFRDAEHSLGRFLINSTIGLFGIFDLVQEDMPVKNRTFDQTLARWGLPPGPYVIWPLLGPSSVRGTFGIAGDVAASPIWLVPADQANFAVSVGLQGVQVVNEFVTFGPQYQQMKEITLDPYIGMKSFYEHLLELQLREPVGEGTFGFPDELDAEPLDT